MEIKQVSLSDLILDDNHPRKHFNEEKLAELKRTILKGGLLSPILVHCDESNESKFIIVGGARRYKVLSELAKDNAKFEQVSISIVNKDDYRAIALVENIHRENLNYVELAQGLQALKDEKGVTQETLSQMVSKSTSIISEILSLNKLPKEILADAISKSDTPLWVLTAVGKCEGEEAQIAEWNNLKDGKITRKAYRDKNASSSKEDTKPVAAISKKVTSFIKQLENFSKLESIDLSRDDIDGINNQLNALHEVLKEFSDKFLITDENN